MKPTEGRVVHYHPRGATGQRPQPALIVDLDPAQGFATPTGHEENEVGVFLVVFTRSCATFPGIVRYHPDGVPGSWRWPPRAEAPAVARQTILPPPPV